MRIFNTDKSLLIIITLLGLNSIYLLGYGSATFFYVANVLLHLFLGAAGGWIVLRWVKGLSQTSDTRLPAVMAWLTGMSGVAIVAFGNINATRGILYGHILLGFVLVAWVLYRLFRNEAIGRWQKALVVTAFFLTAVVSGLHYHGYEAQFEITNPLLPPETLTGEVQGGAEGPFFPSASATADGKLIRADYFTDSKSCARSGCHVDAYEQWESSAHHFSSFNNQWYRKSIEYMQEVVGEVSPKWCSGCHDPALLFSGQMEQKVEDFLDKEEAHAGIGCVACHSIVDVQNTMGNGGYVVEYPALHELLASNNKIVQAVHDFILRIDPEPHRNTFIKPFHTRQTAEFCSSCHKVHLDKEVNNYRWVRGFNTYDNWQASGVSGMGARSFYYPPAPQDCADCHMPRTPSDDPGNDGGTIPNHRFLAANTALATANHDTLQNDLTALFLQRNQLSVDIFAINKVEAAKSIDTGNTARGAAEPGANLATSFAVGEEAGFQVGGQAGGVASEIIAPLDDGMAVLEGGSSVRLDVVVRTRGIGHFFPSGTIDAQEAWLEVQAIDANGKPIFHSGSVANDRRGAVDPGAHFYRNLMLDANGNPINKRNAWATRSVLYVNLIGPGSADVAHYRLNVPADVVGPVRFIAKVNYRKFIWWHNQWAYRGERVPDQQFALSPDYDDGDWQFTGDLQTVSGRMKAVPDIPIVMMASDTLLLELADNERSSSEPSGNLRERWNDYGIGLLQQGDLLGAERAFRKVSEIEPTYTDGWINLARVYLRSGDLGNAELVLKEASDVDPDFHKIYFFRGLLHKARADYPSALNDLEKVRSLYPKDRVVLNQMGRIYYLDSRPAEAIPLFEAALRIDSEDLMAHYNLSLCYRAAGNKEKSKAHELRYRRYKEDENAKAIAREYRQNHPHDNNEAQPIHEHGNALEYFDVYDN